MKRKRYSLWWPTVAWAICLLAMANLHQWAIRDREVAEALLIAYGSALAAIITWKFAGWMDREMATRRAEAIQRGAPSP